MPLESDSAETVEEKWREFITRESYKRHVLLAHPSETSLLHLISNPPPRLILHLFIHDVETSISLQINPLLSYTELLFSLPASRDMWRASTAESWRRIYLSKRRLSRPVPRISEQGMHSLDFLDDLQDHVDVELCYYVVLHGFWGQIAAHRGSSVFYANSNGGTHRLWLKSQHQELYHDLCAFSTIVHTSPFLSHGTYLALVLELFLMILHVSPDELQRFAGKFGEEEARRAALSLEENWVNTPEARHAIWHAGQVFLNARRLPPASLRGFNAITVYLASLALWAYSLLNYAQSPRDSRDSTYLHSGSLQTSSKSTLSETGAKPIYLDGEETMDTKAFLQVDRGVPALSTVSGAMELISNPAGVLSIARDILRENFPIKSEPLPPLVESLNNLLRDLENGATKIP